MFTRKRDKPALLVPCLGCNRDECAPFRKFAQASEIPYDELVLFPTGGRDWRVRRVTPMNEVTEAITHIRGMHSWSRIDR